MYAGQYYPQGALAQAMQPPYAQSRRPSSELAKNYIQVSAHDFRDAAIVALKVISSSTSALKLPLTIPGPPFPVFRRAFSVSFVSLVSYADTCTALDLMLTHPTRVDG
jgi:hypothetical protein